MHGHAAHDDGRYVPAELKDHFATRRDPIGRLRSRLELDRVPHSELDGLHDGVTAEVAAGLAEAESAPPADPTTLEEGVYAMPLKNA